jgi:hypothetical protein
VEYSKDYESLILQEELKLEALHPEETAAFDAYSENLLDLQREMEAERQEKSYIGWLGVSI